jgi:hydrogenase maturation protease
MLIIGCGNPARSDDGAGILVAQRLCELGLDACVYTGESLGVIDLWEHADEVILVDAVMTGASPGTIHIWDSWESLLSGKAPASTHGLGLAEAIGLACSLNRLPSRLRVYAIEGRCFDLGTSVSREIQDAADDVVRQILAKVRSSNDHEGQTCPSLTATVIGRTEKTKNVELSSPSASIRPKAKRIRGLIPDCNHRFQNHQCEPDSRLQSHHDE